MKSASIAVFGLTAMVAAEVAAQMEGSAASRTPALEEIFVTAQRRAESLQDTPISLTAFSSDRLEIDRVSSLADISAMAPGVTIEPWPINAATLIVYIRGVGIEDVQVTQDPSVGIYIDGVYVARASGNAMDVADLERIEVLRGPQGTLYGRNTIGGAVNLITRRPTTDALEFEQKFSVGNRNLFSSVTSANIPLGNNSAIKLAYMRSQVDGFVENTGPGGNFGDREVEAYRLDFRWNPTENFTLDYSYDRSTTDYYNYMYQAILRPVSDKGDLELIKDSAERNTKFSKRRFSSMATTEPMEESRVDVEGHSLIASWNFDRVQLKYIGAYRELYDAAYFDFGGGLGSEEYRIDQNRYDGPAAHQLLGGPSPLVIWTVTQDQWSHELQFIGDIGDRINYVAGLYYFEEKAKEDQTPMHHILSSPLDDAEIPGVTQSRLVVFASNLYEIANEAWAGYAQFSWTPPVLGDRLKLTIGARYSEDKRMAISNRDQRVVIEQQAPGEPPTAVDLNDPNLLVVAPFLEGTALSVVRDGRFDNIRGVKTFRDDSYSFIAEYTVSENINVYGKVVEAYKSGGFNIRDPQRGATGDPETDDSQQPAADGFVYGFGFVDGFDEEKARSYELGFRSELMNRRLRLNASTFLTEFLDRQQNILLVGSIADSKTTNTGEAETRGLELDVSYLPVRGLMLSGNYAYLDARILKVVDTFGEDQTDRFVFFSAPRHAYTANVDYTFLERSWGTVSFHGSHNFVDTRNGNSLAANAHLAQRNAYRLWNARLAISDIRLGRYGSLSAALWGRNLTDEEYETATTEALPQADRVAIWGESRTYGLDLTYRF